MKRLMLLLATMLTAVVVASGVALAAKPISDATQITIKDSRTPPTTANPYPSEITFSENLPCCIRSIDLAFSSFTHPNPDDVDMLLVGPSGAKALLMSDVGGEVNVRRVVFGLSDFGSEPMPDDGPIGLSGPGQVPHYLLTNVADGDADVFPSPAPEGPYVTSLSEFIGTDPSGTWKLYVVDDASRHKGQLGDWTIGLGLAP